MSKLTDVLEELYLSHRQSRTQNDEAIAQAEIKLKQLFLEMLPEEVDENKNIEISVVKGVEGDCIYINNLRVAGSKPWGGGEMVHQWSIQIKDILEAISELKILVDIRRKIQSA